MPVPKGFRERKLARVRCAAGSYRLKTISSRRKLLLCCPSGEFNPRGRVKGAKQAGRCAVGMKAVSMYVKR